MMLFASLKDRFLKNRWQKNLPPVQGKLSFNEDLSHKNWFGTGGKAQIYFEPASQEDLVLFLKHKPKSIPVTLLGAGSNMLIRDGGIDGVTIHLGKEFRYVKVKDEMLTCGGGTLLIDVSKQAQKNCLAGFEFLCGIPGSVGGGVRMNAGAYGSDLKAVLKQLTIVTLSGEVQVLSQKELDDCLSYRQCLLPEEWIFSEAVFQGQKQTDDVAILEKMAQNKQKRLACQPQGVKTCGSTFKNPPQSQAWRLIEKSGARSLSKGDAVVSEKHANFLVNKGKATAKDIEELGNEIRQRVFEKEGVLLEWEIKRVGKGKK